MTEFRNWSGDFACQPQEIAYPNTEAQVAEIIGRAHDEGVRVKVVGAGHSWSDIACTSGYLLRLDHLKRVINVDQELELFTLVPLALLCVLLGVAPMILLGHMDATLEQLRLLFV